MPKKGILAAVCALAIFLGVVILSKKPRSTNLRSGVGHSKFEVVEANDTRCAIGPRFVFVQVLSTKDPEEPSVKINHEDETWQRLEERLRDIYRTRDEKMALLLIGPGVPAHFRAEVLNLIESAGVHRVCAVDPLRLPIFPKPVPGAG